MRQYAKAVDVTTSPELQRIAEEVRATGTPVPLIRNDEIIAVVQPMPKRRAGSAWQPAPEDLAATVSAAGTWADVEVESRQVCKRLAWPSASGLS
jgi:hypothetical protein